MRKILLTIFALTGIISFSQTASAFTVRTSLADNKDIEQYAFQGFGCTGQNKSPMISWQDAPKDTKSFAVTVYDPDAPTGSGWWHWTLFNIPASVNKIEENASNNKDLLPKGAVEGLTDFGKSSYGGMCPPKGDKPHRYIVTVYALKVSNFDLNSQASGAMVGYNIGQNSIASASITVKYGRK